MLDFCNLILFTGFLLNQWRTRQWIHRTVSTHPDTTNPLYAKLLQSLGFKKRIPLCESEELTSPVAVSLWNPRLFVPAGFFQDLTEKQASWILLHELMHVQRYDLWIVTLQRLVQIVFFFNPAVWIANWAVNQFREYACDDAALAICNTTRRDCGEGLLTVLERINQIPSPMIESLGLLQPYSVIRKRLERILDSRRLVQPRLSITATALLIIIGIVVLPYVKAVEPINQAMAESASPLETKQKPENTLSSTIPSMQSYTVVGVTESISTNEPYKLTGTVVDHETGTPIPNADVELYNESTPQNLITKTDQNGRFIYPNLSAGLYHALVLADHYQIHQSQTYDEKDNQLFLGSTIHEKDILIKLIKGKQANITVLSLDGKPADGAKVSYNLNRGSRKYFSVITDAQGKVSLQNLSGNPIQVFAEKDGFGTAISELFTPGLSSKSNEIQVKLLSPVTIKGRVVNKNGNPIQGVPVCAVSYPGNKITKTNSAGEYEFNNLSTKILSIAIRSDETNQYFTEKGKYFFNFGSGEGKSVTKIDYGFNPGETRTMPDLIIDHIKPSAVLQLQIVDKQKIPIPYAQAEVHPGSIDETYVAVPPVTQKQYADKNGIIVFNNYPAPADFYAEIKADGFISTEKTGYRSTFQYKEGIIQIRLERINTISGFVLEKDSKKPIDKALVLVSNAANGILSEHTILTDATGKYEIHDVMPMRYQIHAIASQFVTSSTDTLSVLKETNLENVNFEMERGQSIHGLIRNVTGDPIEKAELSFLSKNNMIRYYPSYNAQDSTPKSFHFLESTSSPDGAFRLSGIPANGDMLIAQADGYAPQIIPLSQEIIQRGEITVTLKSDSKINGIVCDEAGNPVSHCEVNAFDTTRNLFRYSTFTNADGNFSFCNLPNGAIEILINDPCRMFKTVILKSGEVPFVSFGKTGKIVSVQGTLFDKENHPLPHSPLTLSDNDFNGGDTSITVETDDQGKYQFYDILPGAYYITSTSSNNRSTNMNRMFRAKRPVQIESEKTVNMDIHQNASVLILQFFNQQTNAGIEGIHIWQMDNNNRIETAGGASNKDGVLTFASNSAGTFHFIAKHPGYYAKPFSVEIPNIVEDSTIEISLAMKPSTAKLLAHVDSPGIEQLDRYTGSFRAIQGSTQFPLNAKIFDLNKRLLEITCFPEGEMDVYLPSYYLPSNNNKGQMSYPKSFKPAENEITSIDFPITEIERICFHFNMPDSEYLPRGIQVEIPDFENAKKIEPEYRSRDNNLYLYIPAGKHAVRILVPGYKPIECIPSEITRNSLDQIEVNMVNYK